jgi:histidinol-phosphate aminotransferase
VNFAIIPYITKLGAYYAYANDSFLDDIKKYPNLVLLRTVSKIGFAGLRLGLLVGAQDTVQTVY